MLRAMTTMIVVWGSLSAVPTATAATYEQEVLSDSPLLYYRFEESEGTVASDSSGNEFHGEYVGGVDLGQASAGPGIGASALFDGVSGYVQVPALDLELEQASIETWINLEFLAGGCCTSIFSPAGWEPGWLHYNLKTDGNVEFALNSGGPNNHNTDPDTVPFDEWVHVVSVYDMDEALVQTFVNGEEVDVFPPDFSTPLPITLVVEAQIAAWQNTRFLGGSLDEFAIYASALSQERIQAHYDAAMGLGLPGDFNGDGILDSIDINQLVAESASGADNAAFDLNGDSQVDQADVQFWVKDLRKTWIGDANLDGEFSSSDFVQVFQAGKFEQNEDANWSEGDWTGDLRFSSSDFVSAFQDGGFELGPPPAAVPEPTCAWLLLMGCFRMRRRRQRRR